MKRTQQIGLLVAVIASILMQPVAHAGGIWLYETDAGNVGLAGAGQAARAQDATTAFNNPAGMSLITRPEMTLTAQLLYGDMTFSTDVAQHGGNGSGNAVGLVPQGSFAFVQPLNENWRFGISTFSNFGLALDYDNDWTGRYYAQDASLIGMTIMPSLSYRFDEHVSVGMGLNAMYAEMVNHVAINNVLDSLPDGRMEMSDRDWGFGVTPGIMYEFDKKTRVGLTYTSPIDLDFTVKPTFSNLGPGLNDVASRLRSIDMDMTVPQTVMASIFHELNEKWAIMGNAGWQDWSQFGRPDVTINAQDQTSQTADLHFKDTWHTGAGVQYKAAPDWMLSTGLAYDSSMVDDKYRSVALPVGETWRWGFGVQHDLSKATVVNLAYELAYAGDMSIDQDRGPLAGHLKGAYDNVMLHFISASITHRF
jgi:long-chain fatty acid transport protein